MHSNRKAKKYKKIHHLILGCITYTIWDISYIPSWFSRPTKSRNICPVILNMVTRHLCTLIFVSWTSPCPEYTTHTRRHDTLSWRYSCGIRHIHDRHTLLSTYHISILWYSRTRWVLRGECKKYQNKKNDRSLWILCCCFLVIFSRTSDRSHLLRSMSGTYEYL